MHTSAPQEAGQHNPNGLVIPNEKGHLGGFCIQTCGQDLVAALRGLADAIETHS